MFRFAIAIFLLASASAFAADSSLVIFPLEGLGDVGAAPATIAKSLEEKLPRVKVEVFPSPTSQPVSDLKEATRLAWFARARYFVFGNVQRVDGKIRVSGQLGESSTGKSLGSFKATEDEAALNQLNESIFTQITQLLPKEPEIPLKPVPANNGNQPGMAGAGNQGNQPNMPVNARANTGNQPASDYPGGQYPPYRVNRPMSYDPPYGGIGSLYDPYSYFATPRVQLNVVTPQSAGPARIQQFQNSTLPQTPPRPAPRNPTPPRQQKR